MRILVAGWDSGGGVEAVQTVVRRAAARGHQLRVLGTEGDDGLVVDELERAALERPAVSH